jgi:hypothetical protein
MQTNCSDPVAQTQDIYALLTCVRTKKLRALARELCHGVPDRAAQKGGEWKTEQVFRVYGDYEPTPVTDWHTSGPVLRPQRFTSLKRCCKATSTDDVLLDCLHSARPTDFSKLYVADTDLTWHILRYINAHDDQKVESVLEFGSGKGNWLHDFGTAGVRHLVGIEPSFMGSLAYYADGWEDEYRPVQLDAFLGDESQGDLQIVAFLCQRFGTPSHLFDVVWTVETFEHIPSHLHDEYLRRLVGFARKWVITSIAPPKQPGIGHVSPMTREEWRLKWEQFGFVEDTGIASVMRGAKWLQFRRNVMLLKKTVPGSFPSVTH